MDEIDDLLSSIHDHLEATEDVPMETEASRWLGEAQAVAEDVAHADLDEETVHERVETILELLEETETTGNETADEHVDAARRAARRVLERR
jgi:hypothetical protein